MCLVYYHRQNAFACMVLRFYWEKSKALNNKYTTHVTYVERLKVISAIEKEQTKWGKQNWVC